MKIYLLNCKDLCIKQLFVNNGYNLIDCYFLMFIVHVAVGHKRNYFITTYQNVQQTPLSDTLYKTLHVWYVNTYQRQGMFLVNR